MTAPFAPPTYTRLPAPDAAHLREYVERELANVVRALAFAAVTPTRTVSGAWTLTIADGLVCGDATSAAFAVTLPLARTMAGRAFAVKKVDSSGNAVTVTAAGSDVIDGASTYALSSQYESVTLRSDGATWWIQ